MAKAKIHIEYEEKFPDGSVVSVIIWLLPERTNERPHGYKYRLNYCASDGTTLVRYDNRTGKGDHKHIRHLEIAYKYKDIAKLTDDFYTDVIKENLRK